jgi:RimJ/RimL family protein N-acetyltransferase
MADEVRLRDGTRALVWSLLPSDREALVEGFEQLSPESRRHRFLSPVVHLSETMLEHLVDNVDGVDHVALVIFVENGDSFDPVGIGRIVRYREAPAAADLAVTVNDEWQGRGVASALLPVLVAHRPAGVTHIITEVATDNPASLAMLRRLGPTTVEDTGMGVYDVDVDLTGAGERLGDAATSTGRMHPVLEPALEGRRRELRTRDSICPWLQ